MCLTLKKFKIVQWFHSIILFHWLSSCRISDFEYILLNKNLLIAKQLKLLLIANCSMKDERYVYRKIEHM